MSLSVFLYTFRNFKVAKCLPHSVYKCLLVYQIHSLARIPQRRQNLSMLFKQVEGFSIFSVVLKRMMFLFDFAIDLKSVRLTKITCEKFLNKLEWYFYFLAPVLSKRE